MKAIIVDDEQYIRDELKYYLEAYNDIEVVNELSNGEDVLPYVKENPVDLVFLDINLQADSGIIIARKLSKLEHKPIIVFVTALNNHAVEGFEIGATDYIVKPIMEARFKTCIERIRKQFYSDSVITEDNKMSQLKKVVVKKADKLLLLDIHEIIYLEYVDKEIKVITKDNIYSLDSTLKQFVKEYTPYFIRTHKSFVVNCDYITEIIPWFNYKYKLKIKHFEDLEIPVSRTYLKEFKEVFNI